MKKKIVLTIIVLIAALLAWSWWDTKKPNKYPAGWNESTFIWKLTYLFKNIPTSLGIGA